MLDDIQTEQIRRLAKKYESKLRQFGYQSLLPDHFDGSCPRVIQALCQLDVWAVQGAHEVIRSMDAPSPYAICFGFRPSRFHLGHLTLARELAWHMENGARAYAVVVGTEGGSRCSDEDAARHIDVFWRIVQSFAKIEHPKPAVFGDGSSGVLRAICDRISQAVPIKKILSLYGWDDTTYPWDIQGALVNAATYLLPGVVEPIIPWINTTDINQLAHTEFARIAAKRLGLPTPAFSLRKLLPSLRGVDQRMSGKHPKSVFFLDEDANILGQQLLRAVSGGQPDSEMQRRLGGDPHGCAFFHAAGTLMSRPQLELMASNCRSGSIMCGECKRQSLPILQDAHARLRVKL